MKNLTFKFENLPSRLLNSTGDYTLLKWKNLIEKDIKFEINSIPKTEWIRNENTVILKIELLEKDSENVKCLLHNLHQGELFQ